MAHSLSDLGCTRQLDALIWSSAAEILPEYLKGLRFLQFTPAYCLRV
jgi:hypothetical protein